MINRNNMRFENENFGIIAGIAIGAIGGLLLGNYLWGAKKGDRTLSNHLATLSKILEQIENIDSEEAESLKGRIENIIKTVESNYDNP